MPKRKQNGKRKVFVMFTHGEQMLKSKGLVTYAQKKLSFKTQKLHKQLWCAIFPLGKISERKAFAEKKTKSEKENEKGEL